MLFRFRLKKIRINYLQEDVKGVGERKFDKSLFVKSLNCWQDSLR